MSLGTAENLIQVTIWTGSIIFQFLNQTCLCSSTQGFEIQHLAQGYISYKYRDQCLQLIRDSRKRWGWRGRPLFFASEGICILEVKVKFLKDELDHVTLWPKSGTQKLYLDLHCRKSVLLQGWSLWLHKLVLILCLSQNKINSVTKHYLIQQK